MSLCLFAVWLRCVLLDTNLSPLTWMLVRGGWEHLCWPQILAGGEQTAAVAALPAGAVEVGQPQRLGLAVWRRWGGGILVDHGLGVQTHILRAQAGRRVNGLLPRQLIKHHRCFIQYMKHYLQIEYCACVFNMMFYHDLSLICAYLKSGRLNNERATCHTERFWSSTTS